MENKIVFGMCDKCGEVVYSKTSLLRHKHGNCKNSTTRGGFHCLEYGIALREVDQFMKHMKELHSTDLKDEEVHTFPSKQGNETLEMYLLCLDFKIQTVKDQTIPEDEDQLNSPNIVNHIFFKFRAIMNPPVPVQHTQKPISFNPKLTADQEAALESQFSRAKTLHATDLEILAAEMGVDDKDVKIWYNERLAHWRREQGLSDFFGTI